MCATRVRACATNIHVKDMMHASERALSLTCRFRASMLKLAACTHTGLSALGRGKHAISQPTPVTRKCNSSHGHALSACVSCCNRSSCTVRLRTAGPSRSSCPSSASVSVCTTTPNRTGCVSVCESVWTVSVSVSTMWSSHPHHSVISMSGVLG